MGALLRPAGRNLTSQNHRAQLPGAILLDFLYIRKFKKGKYFIYTGRNLVLSGRNFEWLPGAVDKKSLTTLIHHHANQMSVSSCQKILVLSSILCEPFTMELVVAFYVSYAVASCGLVGRNL